MWDWPEHFVPPKISFLSIYPAEVIDNVDPLDNKSGRVRVRVWPMMRGLPEEVLPWAAPAFGLFEGGMADGGAFTVPNKNARVYVFFAVGDVRSPVYFASAPSKTDGPTTRDPDLKTWKTRSGHLIEIDDATGEERITVQTQGGHKMELKDKSGEETVELLHSVGHVVKLDKDGNIEITNTGSTNVKIGKGTVQKLLQATARAALEGHIHGPSTRKSHHTPPDLP